MVGMALVEKTDTKLPTSQASLQLNGNCFVHLRF